MVLGLVLRRAISLVDAKREKAKLLAERFREDLELGG